MCGPTARHASDRCALHARLQHMADKVKEQGELLIAKGALLSNRAESERQQRESAAREALQLLACNNEDVWVRGSATQ